MRRSGARRDQPGNAPRAAATAASTAAASAATSVASARSASIGLATVYAAPRMSSRPAMQLARSRPSSRRSNSPIRRSSSACTPVKSTRMFE